MPDSQLSFTKAERHALAAGIEILCKRLEALAKEAFDLGQKQQGEALTRTKAKVESEAPDLIADPTTATDKQLEGLQTALGRYLKNLRAAAGTVKGLGKADIADSFTEEATALEQTLVPKLTHQTSLPLAPAPGEAPAEAAPAAGAPAEASAEAAAEPAVDEPEGQVLSIGQRTRRGKTVKDFKDRRSS